MQRLARWRPWAVWAPGAATCALQGDRSSLPQREVHVVEVDAGVTVLRVERQRHGRTLRRGEAQRTRAEQRSRAHAERHRALGRSPSVKRAVRAVMCPCVYASHHQQLRRVCPTSVRDSAVTTHRRAYGNSLRSTISAAQAEGAYAGHVLHSIRRAVRQGASPTKRRHIACGRAAAAVPYPRAHVAARGTRCTLLPRSHAE